MANTKRRGVTDGHGGEGEGTRKRFRTFEIEARERDKAEGDTGPALYDITFSSETPVLRRGWAGNWTEVLGHGAGEVDTSYIDAGAAVLVDHGGDQVGVLRNASIADGKGRGSIEFSRNARPQEIERDVKDGIRRFISVGYMVDSEVRTAQDKVAGDTFRVTRWTPIEVSVVATPADISVGFGRAAGGDVNHLTYADGDTTAQEESKMKFVMGENKRAVEVADTDPRPALTVEDLNARGAFDGDAEREAMRESEGQRIADIRTLVAANKLEEKVADDMIRRGLDVVAAGREILAAGATRGTPQPNAESLNVAPKDMRKWSMTRAIRMAAGMAAQERGDRGEEFGGEKFDGIEAEVHRELRKRLPDGAYRGGILVPHSTPSTAALNRAMVEHYASRANRGDLAAQATLRTLSGNQLGKGAETIFEQAGEFIELLRPQSTVIASGARVLSGLSGPVSFPKQSSASTAFWVGENAAADTTDSDIGLGLVLLAAKTLQASTGYTRQLLTQSSVDVEALVRADFAAVHGLAIDRAALHGKGNSGEPTGVYKTPGISTTAMGGVPTYAKIVDQQTQVATANAAAGSLGYITTPGVAGTCRKTLEFAASGSQSIWTGTFYDGMIAGYSARATANASATMSTLEATGGSSHCGIFGNWADLLIGVFGAMELIADPYRLKKRGIIEVVSFQLIDVVIRHPESFSAGTGLTP